MNDQISIRELNEYLRDDLLPSFAAASTMDEGEIWRFRNKLCQLRSYLSRAAQPDSGSNESIKSALSQVEAMLDIAKSLWQLVSDERSNITEFEEYRKARLLNAKAEVITEIEEILSGEDTLKDLIINSFAFNLNWKANTVWVNSAKRAHGSSVKNFSIDLQDQLWNFISDFSNSDSENANLQRLSEVGRRLESISQILLSGQLEPELQAALTCKIYLILTQLRLGKLLGQLKVS